MLKTRTWLFAAALVATACGGGDKTYRAPVIEEFAAYTVDPMAGDYRLISWKTRHADRIQILERTGTDGAYSYDPLIESEISLSGTFEYRVHGNLTLVLRAFNTPSRHDPAEATLDITTVVPEGDHLVAFYPAEPWVGPGENAVLNFTLHNAVAGMVLRVGIVDAGGEELVYSVGEAAGVLSGQFTDADCAADCILEINHHTGFYAQLYNAEGADIEYQETSVGFFEVPLPEILYFTADDDVILVGGSTNLGWEVHHAESVLCTGFTEQYCDDWGECRGGGEVSPTFTTQYTLEATGVGGTMVARVTVEVTTTPTAPTIVSFTATPTEIRPGTTSTLSWDTTLADSVDIVAAPADSTLPSTFTTDGTADVSPTETTTYTLTATNTVGSNNQAVTITVTPLVAGDLVVSEIMMNPATVADTTGEWFEIYNPGTMTVNLSGLTIETGSATDTIDTDVLVPGSGYALLALSSTTTENDSLPTPDFVYSGLSFDETSADSLSVIDSGTTIDAVAWDGSTWTVTEGYSWSLDSGTLTATDNDSFTNWCNGAAMWTGAASNYGSPGVANPSC